MLYKPNFCNQCGEKIERAEWRLATSRRFCDLCATEHPLLDWAPKLVLVFFCLTVLVGVKGVIFPSSATSQKMTQRTAEARPLIDRGSSSTDPLPVERAEPETRSPIPLPANVQAGSFETKPSETFSSPQRVNKSTEAATYVCGAPTKKGTPCSRKVKVKGYCWQHREPAE